MSFRFTPTVSQISPTKLHLAGRPGEDFSLFALDSGSFALASFTGDVDPEPPDFLLPDTFVVHAPVFGGLDYPLALAVEVRIQMAGTGGRTNLLPTVITSGTTPQDLRFSVINTHENEQTQNLILWVETLPKAGEHIHVHVVADAEVDVG